MRDIQNRLLAAVSDGSFLETTYQLHLENRDDRAALNKELTLLHNNGSLNLIDEYTKLTQDAFGHKFFTIRQVFEDTLPGINAPAIDVMQCVKHLIGQAGQDMTAGILFSPFTTYCQAHEDRPNDVLSFAIEHHEDWSNFISPAIIAGTRINLSDYVDKAIRLTADKNIDISSQAIFALGSINYGDDVTPVGNVLDSMKLIVHSECDDQLYAAILRASYSLYLADKTKEKFVSDLIENILERRGDLVLLSASKLFMFERKTLPDPIVVHMLKAFENINPEHIETLNNIDYGLEGLLEKGQVEESISFLEIMFIKNSSNFSISQFDSVARWLLNNEGKILDETITRWLMSGVIKLGRSASELIKKFGGKNTIIAVDVQQIKNESDGIYLFLAKKACGWFFYNPICAVSFILSLIDIAPDEEVKPICEILFNPLLISYSGSVKDHLQSLPDNSSKKIKDVVTQLLSDLDSYHDGLMSVRGLKELEPSSAQRETYQRKWSREVSASYKNAQEGSVFGQIFGKPSVLLYGNSSIHYIHHGTDGETSRQEIPLQSISTSIEFPSLDMLAPHELEMKLYSFKLEGCTS